MIYRVPNNTPFILEISFVCPSLFDYTHHLGIITETFSYLRILTIHKLVNPFNLSQKKKYRIDKLEDWNLATQDAKHVALSEQSLVFKKAILQEQKSLK